jgi:hypothetical protein
MKHLLHALSALWLALAGTMSCHSEEAPSFYVNIQGSDNADGSAEKPFKTIKRAQLAVRQLKKKQPARKQPIVVRISKGTHSLQQPVAFTPEDSGTEVAPVIFEGDSGSAVISGGERIKDWKVMDGRWVTTLPEVRDGRWRFSQLFVNGQRRFRPRLPKKGYYFIQAAASSLNKKPNQQGHNRFHFHKGNIRSDWTNLNDIEVLNFHSWSMSRTPIAAVDDARNLVTLAGFTWNTQIGSLPPRKRYLLENVPEALSDPGEWYLDKKSGVLTYIPMPGEKPDQTEVIAPKLDHLISFRGDLEREQYVEHIHLRGLTFMHTNWNVPADGYSVAQSEVSMRSTRPDSPFPSAIDAEAARNCSIEKCTIAHTGFYALDLGPGCRNNQVVDCEMWDLGAGGVMLGATDSRPAGDNRLASNQLVKDCLIAHGGRLHPAAVGVWIGHSSDNQVLHNDIRDFYYTGISVGWTWHYGYSPAKRNLISHNHIYEIGQHRLSDLGGIYTLGASEGTVLQFNRIHDISRVDYGGSGIYFDQGTMGILVENNVIYDTQDATFTVHWGKENTVRNNILVNGENIQLGIGRHDKSGALNFEKNIIAWSQGRATLTRKAREDWSFSSNVYWPTDAARLDFGQGLSFEEWQKIGKDEDSIIADPRFVSAENMNFELRENSPAFKLGFKPFRMDDIGRQTKARRSKKSPIVPHGYPGAGPPPPMPISMDFESFNAGDRLPGVHVFENNKKEVVRVTDEDAASGKRSLKVTDGPGPGPNYNPHFHFRPGYKSGTLVCSFDLRLEPGSQLTHEWRDWHGEMIIGPSIRIDQKGVLFAGKRELMKVPHSKWIGIKITCGLGRQARGKYDLTVRLADGTEKAFESLPCAPNCRLLNWLGWVASGTESSTFYLDNLKLEPLKAE